MSDLVELFPVDGAVYWLGEKVGSVRDLSVHVVSRKDHPHDLRIRLAPIGQDPGFVLIGRFAVNQVDECGRTARAVLEALQTADLEWAIERGRPEL